MVYFPPNGTFNPMYYPYYGKKAQVRLNLNSKYYLNEQILPLITDQLSRISRHSRQNAKLPVLKMSWAMFLQVNYSQPLVAVKFLNITTNQDVNIECKINANNIPLGTVRDKWAGRVSFKLRINTNT